MFSKKNLQQLDALGANLLYTDENNRIIFQSPTWINNTENGDKIFSVYTLVFDNYSDLINHIMGNVNTKVKLDFINNEEYENLKFNGELL